MPLVSFDLTDKDRENAIRIMASTPSVSLSHAVAVALALTRFVVDQIALDNELVLRSVSGQLTRVKMAALDKVQRA